MTLRRLAPFFARMAATPAATWAAPLRRLAAERLHPERHGDLPGWLQALESLPRIEPGQIRLDAACVQVEEGPGAHGSADEALRSGLDALHPWRKGPFCLHGVRIDAEWRADWKWARAADAITPLAGRQVLDVGCGNGYYGYRALGAGAALVLGIDPTLRFVLQFLAVNQYLRQDRLAVLPAADTDLPLLAADGPFDTALSMGVLYHRRDADAHLAQLYRALRPGGELVLETLVLPHDPKSVLRPPGRYARMRNVHAIPGIDVLRGWLDGAGFRRVEVADVTPTTTDEQRSTPWMRFESLAQCLSPGNPQRTIEGHPAPTRALLTAQKRGQCGLARPH